MFLGRQVPGWTSSWKDEFPPDKFQKGQVRGGFSRKDPKFICIGYKLPTFGEYMPVERFLCALRAQGWGMYIFVYVLLLDINCQHLGNICHLEGFCAPFECRVGELPLGKFLGRHVPWWTSSQGDKFLKRQFPPVQLPKRTSSQYGRGVVWGKVVQGELVGET